MKLRGLIFATTAFCAMGLSGCHSAFVNATVRNNTGAAISLLEVDYPSASFGKETLPDGGVYHYRFKILGNGNTKVSWTDAGQHEHTMPGPALEEGEEGDLIVTLTPQGVAWNSQVHKR